MSAADVYIVQTGAANVASVRAALERCGMTTAVTDQPEHVREGRYVVLPGVGSFEAAMTALRTRNLIVALQERIHSDRPTLAICLGLQLLCAESEESPGVAGLSILPQRVTRFTGNVRSPQFGWNRVSAPGGARFLRSGYAYFANSYIVPAVDDSFVMASARHGVPFVAAVERGQLLACQFHPELSGAYGDRMLRRWLGREDAC